MAPIRILRDAFADDMPHTDVLVSPDHAIFVDGKLICARQLVNGTTIRQETRLDGGRLLPRRTRCQHAILLAEGLPAESYLDTGNQRVLRQFRRSRWCCIPDLTDESDYPTREAGSCVPFVWDEASVQPVWQRLADRAAAIGRPVPQPVTTTEADLRLLRRRNRRVTTSNRSSRDSDRVLFVLPRGRTRGPASLARAIADRGASLAGGSSPAWRPREAHRAAQRR